MDLITWNRLTNTVFCIHDLGDKNGCRPEYMAVMQENWDWCCLISLKIDISSRGLFGTRTFRHKKISAWVYFGTMDILAQGHYGTGTFRHKDISANGCFGTYTFWHHAKQSRLSPSVITFFPISEFFYKLIWFSLYSSFVKSDNEIGKFPY